MKNSILKICAIILISIIFIGCKENRNVNATVKDVKISYAVDKLLRCKIVAEFSDVENKINDQKIITFAFERDDEGITSCVLAQPNDKIILVKDKNFREEIIYKWPNINSSAGKVTE